MFLRIVLHGQHNQKTNMNETQQLKQEINNLNKKIKDLEIFVESLKSSKAIPLSIDQAFRKRFSSNILATSTKTGSSEWVNVDESGADSYSVASPMDGFKAFNDSGVTFYIPYYL